jgi:hypothetical protein
VSASIQLIVGSVVPKSSPLLFGYTLCCGVGALRDVETGSLRFLEAGLGIKLDRQALHRSFLTARRSWPSPENLRDLDGGQKIRFWSGFSILRTLPFLAEYSIRVFRATILCYENGVLMRKVRLPCSLFLTASERSSKQTCNFTDRPSRRTT